MKKIRIYLIHLLGGVTKREDLIDSIRKGIELIDDMAVMAVSRGSLEAVNHLKRYADSLNGITADEWCKRMYDAIAADVEKYQRQYDESKKLEKHEDS